MIGTKTNWKKKFTQKTFLISYQKFSELHFKRETCNLRKTLMQILFNAIIRRLTICVKFFFSFSQNAYPLLHESFESSSIQAAKIIISKIFCFTLLTSVIVYYRVVVGSQKFK